jgi:hypothetical protein
VANKKSRSNSGSLAGWLFADLAIVLAIAFLQSSIGSGDAVQPQDFGSGVSIEPCVVKFLRVTNLSNDEAIKSNLISEISDQTTCLPDDFFGVVLVFAGNSDTQDDEGARTRADARCESLFQTWDAMNRSSTYCEGLKNDSIDSTYFNLTLFPYVPKP